MAEAKALYFIAVLPDKALQERVRQIKLHIQSKYGAGHALKSPAHLTLYMPFRWEESCELEIIRSLESYAQDCHPFDMRCEGFDCFEPRVIFVKVSPHEPLKLLHGKLLQRLADDLELPISNKQGEIYKIHPHMTVATRDLSPTAFKAAWAEYEYKSFRAAFEVDALTLLKHNGRHWDVYRTVGFGAG